MIAYNNNKAIYNNIISMQTESINTLATMIINDNEIRQAYLYDDSTGIIDHVSEFWEKAKETKLLNEIHFFKAPAESFVNFTLLKSMGTDVSEVRSDIKWATSTKNSSSHTMVCNMYAGIRSTFPILDEDGKILGALSMGKKIDWLPHKIKEVTSLDSFLIYKQSATKNLMKDFYLKFIDDKKLMDDIIIANKTMDIPNYLIKTIDFEQKIQNITINKKAYSLNIYNIYDYDKKIMAYISVLTDLTQFNRHYLQTATIYLFVLLILTLIIYLNFRKRLIDTTNHINDIKNITDEIKKNNFKILNNIDIQEIDEQHELSTLKLNIIDMGNALKVSHQDFENKVNETTKHLEDSLNLVSEYIIYSKTDLKGKITDVSDALCKISGYTRNELIGVPHNILKHSDNDEEVYRIMWETIVKEETWTGEIKNRKKNGDFYWVDSKIVPEYDENNKHIGYLSLRYDITSKKAYEEEHEKLLNEKRVSSLVDLIGNIAHQWRQPLSIISTGVTGMEMRRETGNLDDESFTKICKKITSNINYLSNTIDDFNYFINTDEKTYSLLNMNVIINNFFNIASTTLQDKKINIHINIEETKDLNIFGSSSELIQCLINIFNNAQSALIENDIKDKHIFISSTHKDNSIGINIKDNAKGIPLDIIDNIFDPYFTTKHKSMGTGMGLSMSHNIIESRMHGKIEVENSTYIYNEEEFTGASFSIYLNEK